MFTTIMAGFAFGYCLTDIVLRYRANRRIEEFIENLDNKHRYDKPCSTYKSSTHGT